MTADKAYRMVVLAKQVPDTHHITAEAMKEDGTMNRSALPAIFNPEDLNALEMALQVKERFGGTVTVLTMGPVTAAEVLREALYRGADAVVLLNDKKFAGADTLATSYALERAVRTLGDFDLVFCGRQAIDGDTAQVGPQTAEKLGLPQITYAESIIELTPDDIVVERALDSGKETVRCTLPCLLTVVGTANRPRPASIRRRVQYKLAAVPSEYPRLIQRWPEFGTEAELDKHLETRGLKIPVWTAGDVGAEDDRIGLGGSPTQVYKINLVTLESTGCKDVAATSQGVVDLVNELVQEYMVG